MDFKVVIISGNMTRDPEYAPGDMPRCNFSIAVNNRKQVNGEWVDDPAFIDCVAWGNTATRMSQNTSKGMKLTVQGSLKWRQWDDKDTGKKRSAISVTARQVEWPKPTGTQQDTPQAIVSNGTDDDVPF
jgi:single-strand DNA-binding protein